MTGRQGLAAFLRIWHILGDREAAPPIEPMIPVSKSTWWQGVRDGRFPKPVKLGPRTTAWRLEDVLALIEQLSKGVDTARADRSDAEALHIGPGIGEFVSNRANRAASTTTTESPKSSSTRRRRLRKASGE